MDMGRNTNDIASYRIYRGVEDKGKAKIQKSSDNEDKGQTVTITENPDKPTTPESGTPTGKGNPPKTGDTKNLALLFLLLILSAAGLVFTAYRKYRSMKASHN